MVARYTRSSRFLRERGYQEIAIFGFINGQDFQYACINGTINRINGTVDFSVHRSTLSKIKSQKILYYTQKM